MMHYFQLMQGILGPPAPPPSLEEPLLPEEAPPATAQPLLARALAIVRYIEAITELGAVPPPSALYGFAEVATPYAERHLQPSGEHFTPAWTHNEAALQSEASTSAGPGTPFSTFSSVGPGFDSSAPWGPSATTEGSTGGPLPLSGAPSDYQGPKQRSTSLAPAPTIARSIPGRVAVTLHTQEPLSESESEGASTSPLSPTSPASDREDQSMKKATSAAEGGDLFTEPPEEVEEGAGRSGRPELRLHVPRPTPGMALAGFPSATDLLADLKKGEDALPEHPGAAQARQGDLEAPGEPSSEYEGFEGRRKGAIERLAQIFLGWGGTTSATGGSHGRPESALADSATEADWSRWGTPAESDLAAVPPMPSGFFSPVQSYLAARKSHLHEKTERQLRRAEEHQVSLEEEPPTPPRNTALLGALVGGTGGLPHALHVERDVPEVARAHVTPELMREALEMEAAEVEGADPTGSLVVDMLSKKLERMVAQHARDVRRDRRRRKHAQQAQQAVESTTQPAVHAMAPIKAKLAEKATGEGAPPLTESLEASQEEAGFGAGLALLLRDPGVLAFFLLATLLGFGHGIIGTFLFMYLKHLGGGEGLMGYVLLANALPELPVFYFFGAILRSVGMDTLLLASTAGLGLRIAAYAVLPHVPLLYVLPLETLHALTYACGWSACAIKASKIAPPGLESTAQSLFQGLWTGVGAGAGV